MKSKPLKILFVDDDREILALVGKYLHAHGYTVQLADDSLEALELVKSDHFDIVFTDYKMPGIDGLQLLAEIRKRSTETEVVIVTGYGTLDAAIEAMRYGSYDFLQKPFKLDALRLLLERVADEKRRKRPRTQPNKRYVQKSHLGDLWGRSRPMQDVFSTIEQLDTGGQNVIITGESGTGKMLAAKVIHEYKGFPGPSLVPLSQAEINQRACRKVIEAALSTSDDHDEGVTLYIDRIFDYPAAQRSVLLDAVGEFSAPVRIIAVSETKVKNALEEGTVEKNFLDRLNPEIIHMPSLSERGEDIPLLINHFLYRFHTGAKGSPACVAPDVMETLLAYPWPGNIIQLENVLERAVTMGAGEVIEMDLMPDDIRNFTTLI